MATKKISELTTVNSVQDTDLLIVETSNGTRAVKKNDLFSSVKPKSVSVTLTASGWGFDPSNNWYWQNVTIAGTTINSKIDLQPEAVVLNQMANDGVMAIYISNIDGVLIAYAIGAAPTANLTIQAIVTEVN